MLDQVPDERLKTSDTGMLCVSPRSIVVAIVSIRRKYESSWKLAIIFIRKKNCVNSRLPDVPRCDLAKQYIPCVCLIARLARLSALK